MVSQSYVYTIFILYHTIYVCNTVASAASPTECPSGMVYQQCGSLCPQTCDNAEATICPSGCAEGCFCPHGLVAYNGNCIEPLTCPGTYEPFLLYICTYVSLVLLILYT